MAAASTAAGPCRDWPRVEQDALLFVKLQNVGGKLADSISTIGTVRVLAPVTGRA